MDRFVRRRRQCRCRSNVLVSGGAALVPDEDRAARGGGRAGCDVTISDDDVTRVESCLDDVGRPFVVDYVKSQRRRRDQAFDLCR